MRSNQKRKVWQAMFSENPKVWTSLGSQNKWVAKFKAINIANVETCLRGVEEAVWDNRSLLLYGNAWSHFLAKAKSFKIEYRHYLDDQTGAHRVNIIPKNTEKSKLTLGNHVFNSSPSLWSIAGKTIGLTQTKHLLEIKNNPLSILFWQDLGISIFAEMPPQLDDNEFIEVFTQHLEKMVDYGFGKESNCLSEIVSWPIEWSSLNGIEEIRTPIVKVARMAKSETSKKIIQFHGKSYPVEGADGLCFPFNQKEKRIFSDSKYFHKGLEINIKRIENA